MKLSEPLKEVLIATGAATGSDQVRIKGFFRHVEFKNLFEAVSESQRKGRPLVGALIFADKLQLREVFAAIDRIWKLDPCFHAMFVADGGSSDIHEVSKVFGDCNRGAWEFLDQRASDEMVAEKCAQVWANHRRLIQLKAPSEETLRLLKFSAISQMARFIGHDLGNVLLRIIGRVDLSLLEKDIVKIHKHLQIVMDAAVKGGIVARNLQAFTKKDLTFSIEPLEKVISQSIKLVEHDLNQGSIRFQKTLSDAPSVRMDFDSLIMVFSNLFTNAIQSVQMTSGKPKSIRITGSPKMNDKAERGYEVVVDDSGKGLEMESLRRVFDFSFAFHPDHSGGLGLSVVREIIEAHGGTIAVASAPEEGTKISVWLPLGRVSG